MKATLDNKVISSFLLWVNHLILRKGEAFTNHGSYFYPTNQKYSNYIAYSSPYSQFVSDWSISGANIPTGIYLNNTFITSGQSGFAGYNYEKGSAYFTSAVPAGVTISGNYAVKDFNVSLSLEPEEKIIFEKELKLKPKFNQTPTGLLNDETTYPIIFIKNHDTENTPFALGGQETTSFGLSLYIFSDSRFNLDACISILRDSCRTLVPLLEPYEMPFNSFGNFNSGVFFNYDTKAASRDIGTQTLFVTDAKQSKFSQSLYRNERQVNSEAFFEIVDFTLEKVRMPRSE